MHTVELIFTIVVWDFWVVCFIVENHQIKIFQINGALFDCYQYSLCQPGWFCVQHNYQVYTHSKKYYTNIDGIHISMKFKKRGNTYDKNLLCWNVILVMDNTINKVSPKTGREMFAWHFICTNLIRMCDFLILWGDYYKYFRWFLLIVSTNWFLANSELILIYP